VVEAGENDLQDPDAANAVGVLGPDDVADDLKGSPLARRERLANFAKQLVDLAARLGDLRLGVAEGAAVAGQDEVDLQRLDPLEAAQEFAHRVGAVAVVEEEHRAAQQVVAGDQQLALGLVQDDMGRSVAGGLVHMPGAQIGLHLDPGEQVPIGLDYRVDAVVVILFAPLPEAFQRGHRDTALPPDLDPLLERRLRVVSHQAHVAPGRVHPELAAGALDDRRSQPVVVGVRMGADEQADVLQTETGLGEGDVEAAQAILAADPGVEEDDAAIGGDGPDVAVRHPRPGQRQPQPPDPGQDLLCARLLRPLAIVCHRRQSFQGESSRSVSAVMHPQIGSPQQMASSSPKRAGPVLVALILVAAVANLNLAVANVALPDIGKAFGSGQTTLNLIAVGYSLGLATSVLYLGALGDRYGRKMMLLLGMGLSIPASLLAGLAPSDGVLFAARVLGGIAAGMAFPTTLALITALWAGEARTRAIALWSAIGGAIASLGPLLSGALLEQFDWGSVFLVTLPLAVLALFLAWRYVPAHINETSDPVDNLGGILSMILVAALVLGINLAPVPGKGTLAIGLGIVALAATAAFVLRQRRAQAPLYDLEVASRRIFWVAACAGIIVFGSLMGAMFIGQQFLQNVLDYSTLDSGLAILPAAALMVVVAPRSAKLVEARGARFTLLLGYAFCLLGFLAMLLLWKQGISYWKVGLGYALIGVGVGFAGTPASHSLTGSVPVRRAGMASGTADLQRDLGGAIMQSIFGALLTAGYAAAVSAAISSSPEAEKVTENVEGELTKSFSSAADTASQYPQYSNQIIAAAKTSFLQGDKWAYSAGILAVGLGAALVFFLFPKRDEEVALLEHYAAEDA
jgi:MFS transporter, DHA2 family, multidrug resistance protein